MNRKSNKTSVELDASTAHLLLQVAETWGVSEEEAIRRAVEQANEKTVLPSTEEWWEAFKELQRSMGLTPAKAAEWQEAVRKARR